jgi:predicted negative regulator of RcsB-dependent stress response
MSGFSVLYPTYRLIMLFMTAPFLVVVFVWRQGEKQMEAGAALSAAFIPQVTGDPRGLSADGFLKVASEYSGSQAGAQALLLGAATLFDQGKYAEARQQFEKFTREHRGSPFMAQAFLGIGEP